jgi:D-tyrosyl-tRNA(Tyr) deacylase
MRAVIQRVSRASVRVDDKVVGEIGKGIHILLGIKSDDTEQHADWLAEKCVNLRIFDNEEGKFHYSCTDIGGEVLVVSQFTLFGDCRRGRRPGFTDAAHPDFAVPLYEYFVEQLRSKGFKVKTGIFAARMRCEIMNEGPVTLILDTEDVFG